MSTGATPYSSFSGEHPWVGSSLVRRGSSSGSRFSIRGVSVTPIFSSGGVPVSSGFSGRDVTVSSRVCGGGVSVSGGSMVVVSRLTSQVRVTLLVLSFLVMVSRPPSPFLVGMSRLPPGSLVRLYSLSLLSQVFRFGPESFVGVVELCLCLELVTIWFNTFMCSVVLRQFLLGRLSSRLPGRSSSHHYTFQDLEEDVIEGVP